MSTEDRIYGRNAVRAVYSHRPDAIVRIYIMEDLVKEFGDLLKFAAKQKRAYHVVTAADLEKISKSVHHEGIMVLAKAKPTVSFDQMREDLQREGRPLLFLDRIGNPHNLGAFARTAAHFGVPYMLVSGKDAAGLSPSLARVAQGGLEHVDFVRCEDPVAALKALKADGYRIYGTSSHVETSVFTMRFPQRSVFIFGNEIFGVSKKILDLCDEMIAIPGTGKVESLNVSVACGLVMGLATFSIANPGGPQ